MKLRTKPIEKWVFFDDNFQIVEDERDASCAFLISPLTPKIQSGLVLAATEHEWDKNQRFDHVDFYKMRMDKIDKAVIDWKGVENEDGTSMIVSRKNKELLHAYNSALFDKLLDYINKMEEKQQALEAGNEKNLPAGQNGFPAKE